MPRIRYIKCLTCQRPINAPGAPVYDLTAEMAAYAAGVLSAGGYRCMEHAKHSATGEVMVDKSGMPLGRGADYDTHAKIAGMVETPAWLETYIEETATEKPTVWMATTSNGYSKKIMRRKAADSRQPSLTGAQKDALRALLAGETAVDTTVLTGLTQ